LFSQIKIFLAGYVGNAFAYVDEIHGSKNHIYYSYIDI